jgi:hypothetical protein
LLRQAESDDTTLDEAIKLLDKMPTYYRRRVVATFMWLHRPSP